MYQQVLGNLLSRIDNCLHRHSREVQAVWASAAVVEYSVLTAGALKLQTSVLSNDYANSKAALDVRLAQEQHVSVSIDVWKSNCSQAAYVCDVRLADGTTSLLGAQEVSSAADTAVGVSGRAHLTAVYASIL